MEIESRVLKSERRDELLRAACDSDLALELLVYREGKITKHASRFLKTVISEDGLYLCIQLPGDKGAGEGFHAGQDMEVQFQSGGLRYAFLTSVVGEATHNAGASKSVAALMLAYPLEVENRQRRAHYRVPFEMASLVTVAFVDAFGEDEERPVAPVMYSGLVSDISTGGIAVACRQRVPQGLSVGTELLLSFQLPGESQLITLSGFIRNIRKRESEQTIIMGIEFSLSRGDIEARQQIDLIHRFVVKRQQEMLSKLGRL